MWKSIIHQKPLVSPEYQGQLDNLAETLIQPASEEQLTFEYQLKQSVLDGEMTIQDASQCLDDYTRTFGDIE